MTTAVERARSRSPRVHRRTFGWGIKEAGHGLVFANALAPARRPGRGAAVGDGDYGPLLLLETPRAIPQPLIAYLSDIQPAYTSARSARCAASTITAG